MDEIVERVENNFISIYNKFDIIDKKLNNYHIKIDEINDMIDLIISNVYKKIYKTHYPMKNYDLSQDRFFIYNEIIDIPLKKNSYIIFEYIFNIAILDQNEVCLSDHKGINLKVKLQRAHKKKYNHIVYDFSKAKWRDLYFDIKHSAILDNIRSNDPYVAWDLFKSELTQILIMNKTQ